MMDEVKINFETAKLAKEIGFDVPCNSYYYIDGKIKNNNRPWNRNMYINQYSLPTQSLLQKWLRDNHKTHIKIDYDWTTISGKEVYVWNAELCIILEDKEIWRPFYGNYNSYEEALEDQLQKALILLK